MHPKELIDELAHVASDHYEISRYGGSPSTGSQWASRHAIFRDHWYMAICAVLDTLSQTHAIVPNSGYTDLLARSEKLRGIEWQMNNPCQNCGGDCLECQHYEDKRRYGW